MSDHKEDTTPAAAAAPAVAMPTAPVASVSNSTTTPATNSSSTSSHESNSKLALGLKEAVESLFTPARLSSDSIVAGSLNAQGVVPLNVLGQQAEVQAVWAREKKSAASTSSDGKGEGKIKKGGEGKEEDGGDTGGAREGGDDMVSLMAELAEALRTSKIVQLSEDGTGARPRVARSTIIAREVPSDVTESEIRALFSKWGEAVMDLRYEHGLWYIRFSGEDDARSACQQMNSTPFRGQPLRLRIRSEVGQAIYGSLVQQAGGGGGGGGMGGATTVMPTIGGG
eukprot:evm.model.NODE_301_length_7326_cov_31.964510.1